MIDSGKHGDCALEAAMCKIAGSEALWINVNEALQMAGGQGFIKTLPYERFLRDARILQVTVGQTPAMHPSQSRLCCVNSVIDL